MKSQQNQLIQCPVCKAGLSEDKLIPIYGRSSSNKQHPKDLPNRPKAQRPEAPRNPHFIPQTNTVFGIHFGFGGFHFGEGFQFGFPFPEQQQIQNDPQRQAMSRFLFALAFVVLMSIILF